MATAFAFLANPAFWTSAAAAATVATSAATAAGAFDRTPEPTPMPEAPDTGKADTAAKVETKRRKQAIARSKTVYTSPLGIGEEANIARKTLLGQ